MDGTVLCWHSGEAALRLWGKDELGAVPAEMSCLLPLQISRISSLMALT